MPDLPISGLPHAGALSGTELLVLVQGGITKYALLSEGKIFVIPNLQSVLGIGNNTGAADIFFDNGTAARVAVFGASKELVASPTTAVELSYVNGVTSSIQNQLNALQTGLYWKSACRVASVANVNTSSAPSVIDGVTMAVTNRVLLKNQTSSLENGIWIWNGTSSALTRATDFDNNTDHIGGAVANVEEGTINADKAFVCTSNEPVAVGTDPIIFATFGGTAYLGTAGQIVLTGNIFSIDPAYEPALPATQVGYGDGSNKLTGNSGLTFNDSNGRLLVGSGSALNELDVVGTIRSRSNSMVWFELSTGTTNNWEIYGDGNRLRFYNYGGTHEIIFQDRQIGIGGTPTEALDIRFGAFRYLNEYSASATPSISAGAGAGTSPTISIVGTNDAGVISLTTGTAPATGAIVATITFSGSWSFPNGCAVTLFAHNDFGTTALGTLIRVYAVGGTTTFVINSSAVVGLIASTLYELNYVVKGY